jgi:hypothetical protein
MSLFFLIIVLCTSFTALVAALTLLRVGIWHEERAGSLAREPAGWCTCLARRLLGLHVRCTDGAHPGGSGHAGG